MDLLTWKRNGVTTVGYTAGSVQATTRIDSDAARSSVGEHTRGDLLLIRGGYFIRTLSIVPVNRVSVSYTHLDVYKRQPCSYTLNILILILLKSSDDETISSDG